VLQKMNCLRLKRDIRKTKKQTQDMVLD
jgi:hypothetical protein